MGTMELSKVTSKTSSIKALLLRAWRERWTDLQWGIHIKTILPRGVSGDVYNLADCILQQALIGPGPNHMILSYLKHSLSSQLVSYAALLQHISKYSAFHKPHCVYSLLELLEACQAGITCRGRTEEGILATAMLSIVLWLLQCYIYYLNKTSRSTLFDEILQKCSTLLASMLNSNFTIAMLYLAKHEEKDVYVDVLKKCKEIEQLKDLKTSLEMDSCLKKIQKIDLKMNTTCESVTYCLQPLFSVELAINPSCDTSYLVNQLLMIQHLKGYSNPRLYCEIMRACLISLNNVFGTSEESLWGAFTFLKLPHIFKQLHWHMKENTNTEYSQDLLDAFDLLLQLRPLLDIVDTKGYCNFIDCLLNELHLVGLLCGQHAACIKDRRGHPTTIESLTSGDPSVQPASIAKAIVRAEPTLPRILRTLDADNIKTDNLISILGQVLTGKSFELILAVATVEDKLRIFVQKLIKFNETYLAPTPGESPKQAQHRALLFDISFLILCSICNAYGAQVVLPDENGTSFFETWLKNCMVERGHAKAPESILNFDDSKVEALLTQLNSNEDFKLNQVRWDATCLSVPGAMREVLLAWEQDKLTANDVKRILDTMRSNMCCLPICATAWLCSHMAILHHDALLKPMNMVQQLLAPLPPATMTASVSASAGCSSGSSNGGSGGEEESSSAAVTIAIESCFRAERFAAMSLVVRRMLFNIHPPAAGSKVALQHGIISSTPISTQLEKIWNKIHKQGWINVEATHQLQSLIATGGPSWFIKNVLKEVFKHRYQEELNRAVDLAFAIFHLDIENCTLALLMDIIPPYLHNKLQCDDLFEPQLSALAKICVYCIFSAAQTSSKDVTGKKRSRQSLEADESDMLYPASKLLKLSSNESIGFSQNNSSTSGKTSIMSNELQNAFNELFNAFLIISNRDGEISQQTHFVYKFLEIMMQCGGERTRLILQGQPLDSLIPNLIRWMPDMLSVELIAGLYDVTSSSGRRAAARDLCMLMNLQASTTYK